MSGHGQGACTAGLHRTSGPTRPTARQASAGHRRGAVPDQQGRRPRLTRCGRLRLNTILAPISPQPIVAASPVRAKLPARALPTARPDALRDGLVPIGLLTRRRPGWARRRGTCRGQARRLAARGLRRRSSPIGLLPGLAHRRRHYRSGLAVQPPQRQQWPPQWRRHQRAGRPPARRHSAPAADRRPGVSGARCGSLSVSLSWWLRLLWRS